MSTKLQHTTIRASAGTGKTYQLANRYLALLLLQPGIGGRLAPERIVAMTFTRKGAGEFAGRILHRLAAAAGDDQERQKLQAELTLLIQGDRDIAGLAPGLELRLDAATLQSALTAMIDQYDRLVLGTIDSFMARSVQTLAFELGLGGFEILADSALSRERAAVLGQQLRSLHSIDLEDWLAIGMSYCSGGLEESEPPMDPAAERELRSLRARNIDHFYEAFKRARMKSSSRLQSHLDRFVKSHHPLLHALPDAEGWGGTGFWNGPAPAATVSDYRQDAAALAKTIAGHDFGNRTISKSFATALNWIAARTPGSGAGDIPSWLDREGKLVGVWRAWPEREWTFEFSGRPRTASASIMKPLRPILEAWVTAERAALSAKTAAILDIVSEYEQIYDRRVRRMGRLTFGDLPLLLDERKGSDAAQATVRQLAFRWYQQFDHWLLDEFQDTSRIQWDVLKPWLDEAIQDDSGTKSVFVVADPKQSIYGWRGGEPRLLGELTANYPGAFAQQVMAESWRSRPAVLELVNRVCTPATNPALSDPDKFSAAALARWQYDPHLSHASRQSAPGYSAVLFASTPEAEEDDTGDEENENGGERADKLAAQARVIKSVLERVRPSENGLTCAILVRKNQNAQALAQWLRANGVPQVMVEGVATLAQQSPVVAALVAAVRWLAVPANTLAAGHIQATPIWDVLKEPVKGPGAVPVPPGTVWRHWRTRIADIGAPQVTREWCLALAATQHEPYTQYCLQHVSQLAHQAGGALALPDWLAALEQLAVRETAAAGPIHAMTIHKAKGLGFDVVFLPDLDLGGGGRDDVLIRRDGQGCAQGCLTNPPGWLRGWAPALEEACAAQEAGQELEALCVLYVALTRAKEATFIIMNEKKPKMAAPARDWILSALDGSAGPAPAVPVEPPWGAGRLVWEYGSRAIRAERQDAQPVPAPSPAVSHFPKPVPRRKRRKPSEVGHESFTQAAPIAVSSGGQEFGTAVHEVFEQVEWWTPGQFLQGSPDAVALVNRCLEVPEIRALFTPESGADEALRELPVEFMEKDTWWSGVIDRLVLRRDAGGAVRKAVLIDFKTDQVDSVVVLRERYAGQLAIYRRAISTALELQEGQVEVLLLSTHLGTLPIPCGPAHLL